MNTQYLSVPSFKAESFEKKIKTLNNKARKAGCDTASFIKGPEYPVGIRYEQINYDNILTRDKDETIVLHTEYYLTIPSIIRKGNFRLVATVEKSENGNIILGCEDIPKKYRETDFYCDHCNTHRNRNKVFILTDGEKYLQIGSTCVDIFLGISPAAVSAAAAFHSFIIDFREGDEERAPRGFSAFPIDEFLSAACYEVNQYGFYPSQGDELSTADQVFNLLFDKEAKFDDEKMKQVINWVMAEDPDSDYIYSAQVILQNGYVGHRHKGIIASLPHVYNKNMAAKAGNLKKNNEYFPGEKKQRLDFYGLTLERKHIFEGNYGTSSILTFVSAEGYTFKWFTDKFDEFDEGETYNIKATIRGFEDYKGYKSTMITVGKKIK